MALTWKMRARYLFRENPAWDMVWRWRERSHEKEWRKRFGPPHIIKQHILNDYATAFSCDILIETGTFLGDMIYAMRKRFKEIYSIELNEEFHNQAKKAFKSYPHIHLVAGDSATALRSVMARLDRPALFWLDGHYSGGITAMSSNDSWTPINGELDSIFDHPVRDHVILIDDSDAFDGKHGYPTLFELHARIRENLPGHQMQVSENVIRITPAAIKK